MHEGRPIRAINPLDGEAIDSIRGSASDGDLVCRLAHNYESYWSAFRLVYDSYVQSGLARPNRTRLRFLPHHLLDTSSVLLATREGCGVGTLTIVEDAEYGVPVELLYPREVARLRHRGQRIAELTCLAVAGAKLDQQERRGVMRMLLRSALTVAARRHVEVLTVCIHPRHAKFYRDRLGFTAFGSTQFCPWVCGLPAVAMYRPLRSKGITNRPVYKAASQAIVHPIANASLGRNNIRELFVPLLEEASPFPWTARRSAAA